MQTLLIVAALIWGGSLLLAFVLAIASLLSPSCRSAARWFLFGEATPDILASTTAMSDELVLETTRGSHSEADPTYRFVKFRFGGRVPA